MGSVKTIIELCTSILTLEINLFGYDVTLMGVLCLTGCGTLLLWLIFGLFK